MQTLATFGKVSGHFRRIHFFSRYRREGAFESWGMPHGSWGAHESCNVDNLTRSLCTGRRSAPRRYPLRAVQTRAAHKPADGFFLSNTRLGLPRQKAECSSLSSLVVGRISVDFCNSVFFFSICQPLHEHCYINIHSRVLRFLIVFTLCLQVYETFC